jgi:RNA polymerase sigma factor (sigma-70 family)
MRSSVMPDDAGDFDLTPELEARLDQLATAAQAGDIGARNELYALLAFKINRFARVSRRARAAQRLEPDEVASEAFLVLARLIDDWSGQHFGRYFLSAFPQRLRCALAGRRTGSWAASYQSTATDLIETLADHDTAADLACALVELEAGLLPKERRLLRHRVIDGMTVDEMAAATGLSRRTLQRRWRAVVSTLRLSRER